MTDENRNHWIIVGSPDNFAATREHGFTIQGMKTRQRKKAALMKPGDKIVYYITGEKAFGGIATITSESFEDSTIIWKSTNNKRQGEVFPHRVNIEPELILDDDNFLEAEETALQMKHVQKWPAKNWTLAFQGNVHKIEEDDFQLLKSAIEEHASVTSGSRG
jgi:predicted RNA-binding protein